MDVQPANDQMHVLHCDTISLVAYTVKEDSIIGSETSYNLLGKNNDPIFGKNSASFYTQMRLESDAPTFGINPVCDSIILSLVYEKVYGDTTTRQTVKVYELAKDIYYDSTYYSNREFLTTGTPLGVKTFVPDAHDSITIKGTPDSGIYVPQLRIPLSLSLGQRIFNAVGTTSLSDNTKFPIFFKGLYLTSTSSSGEGSIMSFDLLNGSKVTLYYHNSSDTLKHIYTFVIDNYCARINHFDHSKFQYANSYLKSEIFGDTSKGKNVLYLQSMAGLKIRILYPYIRNLKKYGKIAINKADLIVDVDDSTDVSTSKYAPPYELVLVDEKNGVIRFLTDLTSGGVTYFGGIYNSTAKEYKFNIARQIQQVIDGIEDNDGLSLLVWTADRPNTANRVVLKGTKRKTGNLRLQITYTKLY